MDVTVALALEAGRPLVEDMVQLEGPKAGNVRGEGEY